MSELTYNEVLLMIKVIKANYTYAYKDAPKEDIDLLAKTWVFRLKKYPVELVKEAFYKVIDTSKRPPVVADLIEQIEVMYSLNDKTPQMLWAELDRAIYDTTVLCGRFGYTAIPCGETRTQGQIARDDFHRLYNNLDKLIKDYLGSPQQLLDLAGTTFEVLNYEKARFLKVIPEIRARNKRKQEMTPEIKNLLNGTSGLKNNNELKQLECKQPKKAQKSIQVKQ